MVEAAGGVVLVDMFAWAWPREGLIVLLQPNWALLSYWNAANRLK